MIENLSIESYSGIPVRVIDTEIGKAIPAGDVARAIGCSRNALTKIMSENPHLFKGVSINHPLPTAGGTQLNVCLNQDGLIAVLMRASVGRSGTEEGKERIRTFQIWAQKTLSKVMNGEPVKSPASKSSANVPEKSPSQIAYEASKFAKMTGSNPKDALAAMLRQYGHGYLVPVLPDADALPVVPAPSVKPAGWLNATDIAKIIGCKPHEVNMYLYNRRPSALIVKDGERPGEWRITDAGRLYGEERMYEPSPGHKVYRTFWRQDVLRLFGVPV